MKKIFTSIVAVFVVAVSAWAAQTVPSTGTDFWLTFMDNFDKSAGNEYLQLEIIAIPAADGTISITGADGTLFANDLLTSGTPYVYQVPIAQQSKVYNTSSGIASATGLHVESSTELVLYMRNAFDNGSDMSMDMSPVIATPALGTEYMVQTYYRDMKNSEFAVVATDDNSNITITFNHDVLNDVGEVFAKGSIYTFSLQRGEACLFKSSNTGSPDYHNLSGTRIHSSKPIAVFNGGIKSTIPYNSGANSDHTMEQSIPVSAWGKQFVLMEMSGFPYRDAEEGHVETSSPTIYSITAYYDNTEIYVNGTLAKTLNAGESTPYTGSGQIKVGYDEAPKLIETSQPVIVYGYMTNAASNSYNYEAFSEPSMALVPDVSKGLSEAAIYCTDAMQLHYANVVVPTAFASDMRLNGEDISSQFTTLANTFSGSSDSYSYARIALPAGANKLSNASSSFVAIYYGAEEWKAISEACATVMNLSSCILASGKCGAEGDSTNVVWSLGCDSVLTIRGSGAMADYAMTNHSPWNEMRLAIKSSFIENGVTSVGDFAFRQCSNMTSVTIGDNVNIIGSNAFEGCSGLTSVNIPGSVTIIRDFAFSNCTSLTSVNIPNGVTTIGDEAFEGCSGLTSITIPSSVIDIIDPNPFGYCVGLTNIVVESENPNYDSRENCNAIIETSTNTLIVGCKNTTIPNSVTRIENNAFTGCSGLTSITIPNSVTTIGAAAFYVCSSMTSVTIGNNVTYIDSHAFGECSGLTSITCMAATPPTIDVTGQVFINVSISIPVYVPAESVESYQAATGWSDFTNIIAIDGNTTGGASDTIRLYCRVTQAWWTTEDAAVGLYAYAEGDIANAAWPGARMSKVEGEEGLWFADVDRSLYTNIIFTRVNGSGTIADWGAKTADLTIPTDGNNLYTITSAEAVWGDPGVEGVWSYYNNTAGTGGVTITGYSLVGDSALFGGAEWDVTNEATNMTQTGDYTWTYTIASVYLKAYRNYEYKVVANHSWGVADYPSGSNNYILAVEQSGTYKVLFTFDSSTGCAATANLIQADESGSGTDYSNYAAVINLERMVQFVFSGTDEDDRSQYEAHVQLNQGDTLYIRDRSHNVMLEFTVEEYGAYNNFTYTNSGSNYNKIAYVVCQQSGCYDLFYKSNYSLYLGEGTGGCSEGEPYDEGSMQTAHVSLYGDYGYVYINDNVSSGDFVLGSTITLSAQPYSNYQFLEWSDGNYANPRQFIVTGDTTISASFGSKAFYPTGILLNRKKFIRSTFNDGTQLIVRANIAQGDTVELYFINDNIFWMAPVEQYGAYQNFSGGEAEGRLICNVAGCYDIYFKLEDGLTQSIYIGEGTQCFDGEDWVSPIRITQEVCYLIGKNDILGAWDLAQARPISKNGTTFTLPAGMYQFKLLPQNDSWENSYGYSYVYAPCSSANIATDGDGNIVIAVEEDTDVTISFGDNGICLTGNFTQANTGVHLTTGASPEEAGIVSVESGDYLLEQELTLQASISTGGWEFDKWSDGVTDNPRTVKLTQDTTIMAIFTPGEYGILINRRQLARGTFTGRIEGSYIAQFKSSVTLQQGDKIQLINLTHGTNSTWRPELEDGGLSANFSIHESDEQKHQSLVCNLSGCYDIYSKIHYGQSNDVLYIGAGEDCQPTEYFPIDLTDSITGYSVVGTANLFGTDWDVADTKTNMTLSPMGVYIYTLDSVTLLPDSIYQYKIIANHTWNVDEYPSIEGGDNYYISVQNAGVYSVTFTLTQGERGGAAINYLHAIPASCTPIASGECGADGDNLTWVLDCDSVLTISGYGAMADYSGSSSVPWHDYQSMIRRAVISSGVTSLSSSSTFENCTALQSVVIPEGITSLGMYTFSNCTSLKGVDLPSTLLSIGSYCFSECWAIDSITCRATTPPEANGSSLSGVNYMIPIYVPAGTAEIYKAADGWSGFTDYRDIIDGCVVASGECGAEGNNLMWILYCDSVLTIRGTGAMENYSFNSDGQAPWAEHGLEIRDIVIEEGVRTIGAYAFYNAGSYTNGVYNNVRSVTIPSTVTKLQNNYFYQCPVQTVTLNSDSIVGQTTYSSNASLHKMFGAQVRQYIIGDSVKSIASSVFYNQSADSLKSILLPEGLTSIGSWAFGYLENLDSITLPRSLQSIGSDAFYGSGLRAVTIPGSVTDMGGQAFQNCDKLASVILEEGLTTLGTSAFQNCTALTEITIPESMVTISSGAFTDCTHLTKMTILATEWVGADKSSSSTTKLAIGNYVRELILGDQIPTIGKYAFSSLDSLRTVTLPFNVTSISNYAFSSCPSLTCVISNALTPPTIQSTTFSTQDTLIVPCESKQLYKTAQYWQNFNRIRCADDQEMSISLTGNWTFIMVPSTFGMDAGDVTTEGDVQWATYNGSVRAMGRSGWENYSAEAVHMCSQALIVRATGASATLYINVPTNATAMAGTSVTLIPNAAALPQNANWCFTGNPYPYGYLLSGLAAQGITSPIAVWNGTGYDTYTPGIDDYIIPAFGAFFIQLPEGTVEPTVINFSAEYIYM